MYGFVHFCSVTDASQVKHSKKKVYRESISPLSFVSPGYLHKLTLIVCFSFQDEANSVPAGIWSCTELLSGSGIGKCNANKSDKSLKATHVHPQA